MDKYCNNCKRMVGTKKNLTPGVIMIVVGIVLFMFLPFFGWLIGAPIAIIGLIALICGGNKCSICGGKNLLEQEPVEKAPSEEIKNA